MSVVIKVSIKRGDGRNGKTVTDSVSWRSIPHEEAYILECLKKRISRVDVLAFEFEMGLFPNIQEEAKAKGIDLAMKHIPRDVFDKQAVEKNQMVFHDVS